MEHGCHTWRVKLRITPRSYVTERIGVTAKRLPTMKYPATDIYGWMGGRRRFCGERGDFHKDLCKWKDNDIIEMELDCDYHTLTMTNLSSGRTDVIRDLPETVLYPYFAFFWDKGDSMELLSLDTYDRELRSRYSWSMFS